MLACSKDVSINTYRAADDVVLVRVPTNISDTRVMARQFGDHSTGQHIIDCRDTQDDCIHSLHESKNGINLPEGLQKADAEVQRSSANEWLALANALKTARYSRTILPVEQPE